MCLFGTSQAADIDTSVPVKSILCYGDSLTAGYFRFGSEFHPYGNTLAAKSGLPVTAVGMSGWTTEQMVQSAEALNVEDIVGNTGDGLIVLLKKQHWDLVCLMAGTNDLGMGVPTEEILENIESMVKMCLNSNPTTKIALLTVPATGGELTHESVRKRRATVNTGLSKFATKHSHRVLLIDPSAVLSNPGPRAPADSPDKELWDHDTLHFSPKGSERLGEFVYHALLEKGLIVNTTPNTV